MSELKDLLTIFKIESEEHLTKLENGLIELERRPGDKELLRRLIREVHTLKGGARVFGFTDIQDLTHRMEDVLEAISSGKILFDSYSMERMLRGIDTLRILLGRILGEESPPIDLSEIKESLESCLSRNEVDQEQVPCGPDTLPLTQREGSSPSEPSEAYLKVSLSRLDRLLYLIGEVVIQRMKSSARISQTKRILRSMKEVQRSISKFKEATKEDRLSSSREWISFLSQWEAQLERVREEFQRLYEQISSETFHLDPIMDQLQTKARELKMVPLSTIFEGFPRMVRDMASQLGKEIHLLVSGEETELDKKVIERIKSSLIHLLRNAIDHGIEEPQKREAIGKPREGTIKISARNERDRVVLSIEDDGKGIDVEEIKANALRKGLVREEELLRMTEREILNLIFAPGYSSSSGVTELSGRGMGLDIVMKEISQLSGRVSIETQKGQGTRFTLSLPLSIALLRALLVRVGERRFFLPLPSLIKVIRMGQEAISTLDGRISFSFEDRLLPLLELRELLGIKEIREDPKGKEKMLWVVVVTNFKREAGLIVDEVLGDEEVFVKSLGKHLGKAKFISGGVLMLDGEVVFVLDVEDLLAYRSYPVSYLPKTIPSSASTQRKGRILVVEDVFSTRELERSILENHGYLVDTAVDGLDALNQITRNSYDLILSDIEMPRMDGFELCQTLKKSEAHKDIPFVILTSFQREEDRRRGMEVGASAYLVKGAFDQTHLLETIDRLIG
jgi:two-component system chemotaxis sensor kinase CheA